MLTADLALDADPSYSALTQAYAADLSLLETDFGEAWYKLMTRDVNYKMCIGDMTPDPRHWQMPLPAPTMMDFSDFQPAYAAIKAMLDDGSFTTAELTNLAFRCASTYRMTDHSGGCDGYVQMSTPCQDASCFSVNLFLTSFAMRFCFYSYFFQ